MSSSSRGRQTGDIRVGISGWTYKPWRGTFYPKGLSQKDELRFASQALPSIEINGTFYSLQKPGSYATWYEQTPGGFVFAVKGPRFITHMKRLRNVEAPLANFFVSGVLRLNEKLGPILWQLPPNMKFDADVFEAFCNMLPRTTRKAANMIKQADARMAGRSWIKIDQDRPLRYAFEIRHESFATEAFIKLLRKLDVALVVADTAGRWPMLHDVTADFVYVRLHGAEELYASGYTDAALEQWKKKVATWAGGGEMTAELRLGGPALKRPKRDVFVYFDNDIKVRSPFDAASLAFKLKLRKAPLPDGPHMTSTESPRLQWPGVKPSKQSR